MVPRLLRLSVWLLATMSVAVALHGLAQWQLHRQLVHEAAVFLAPLARGDTPYRWPLRKPGDLVGRRVFGDCDIAFDRGGLVLRRGSRTCEIGVPLRTPLDLKRFDRLEIISATPLPSFWLVLREQLDQPQQIAQVTATEQTPLQAQLGQLAWRLDSGEVRPPPSRAAMLRLRFGELTQDLRVQAIALQPQTPLDWVAATWLPADNATESLASAQFPLFRVDGSPRPETVLGWRDLLREREPASLMVFGDDVGSVTAAMHETPSHPGRAVSAWPWALVGVVALAMLATFVRPAGPVWMRASLQAVLALILPVWLVVGLQLGDDLGRPAAAAIAVSLLYAVALACTDTATRGHWIGSPRAWLRASAAPLVALGLVLILGRPGAHAAISVADVIAYALWALLQQYLICVVFADRLYRVGLPARWTVLAAAGLFALLHTPNATLMLATFCGGLIWTALWLRERSLIPLALSHATAALLLGSGLPPTVLRSAEVSLRYYL
ncbi:CPBP family glutamic-type intramembrane protease [Tahibacter sp.]|uniref:CPBP family glutamic-type intramembrane protease n=1 Tax=Tahibacter sp. TaxID=2056211 RepID=UPI0028C48B43|nr:CPBP family glutamic-type intramembrane protease [Tahibacter sp.]